MGAETKVFSRLRRLRISPLQRQILELAAHLPQVDDREIYLRIFGWLPTPPFRILSFQDALKQMPTSRPELNRRYGASKAVKQAMRDRFMRYQAALAALPASMSHNERRAQLKMNEAREYRDELLREFETQGFASRSGWDFYRRNIPNYNRAHVVVGRSIARLQAHAFWRIAASLTRAWTGCRKTCRASTVPLSRSHDEETDRRH
jgi:hypothetical protein